MAFSNKQNNLVEKGNLSPLTTKLQHAGLQSQLPKVQKTGSSSFSFNTSHNIQYQIGVEPLIHKSLSSHLPKMPILPLLYSYSTNDSLQCSSFPNHDPLSSKALTIVGDFKFGEELEPNTMIYFNVILMKEDIDDKL
jgi:hypothetical protein